MYAVHNKCLVCNSTELVELTKYSKDYLVQCSKCNFVFCKRIPTQEELISHYKQYHRGGFISPITIKRYHQLLDEFEPYRKTNNLLDVGCGDGYFLEEAKKRGWNVYGTEFSDEAIQVLKSKNILYNQGKLSPHNYSLEMFDVITSFEVIEHINNPNEETENVNSILRTGGLYYITTPNFNSFSRFILKHNWKMIEYPEHLCYYSPKTLNLLLDRHRFKKEKVITSGISLTRFIISTKQTNASYDGHQREENLRKKSETKFIFKLGKNVLNKILNALKIGDALKAYYTKR